MPMELNLLDIEMAALRMNDETMRDEVRIGAIAKRIKQVFPEVDTDSARSELATLVRQLNHYTHLNRIVLFLPGIIKGNQSDKDLSEKAKKQLDDMGRQVEQLGRDLRKERDEREAAKAQLASLKTNYSSLRALYEKANMQIADVKVREQQARQDAERWHRAAMQADQDSKAAHVEMGTASTSIERLQREYQALNATFKAKQLEWAEREQELSTLRKQVSKQTSEIKNLNDAVKQREQAIERLRGQLEDDGTPDGSPAASEDVFGKL